MPREDAGLLRVQGGISGQLQDFGDQVLQDGGQVGGAFLLAPYLRLYPLKIS